MRETNQVANFDPFNGKIIEEVKKKKPLTQSRKCLGCLHNFESLSKFNRVCDSCKEMNQLIFAYGQY